MSHLLMISGAALARLTAVGIGFASDQAFRRDELSFRRVLRL
jgi:hypothetical protein